MTTLMDPEEDYLSIIAMEEDAAAAEAKRNQELDQAHANLKGLSFNLLPRRLSSYLTGLPCSTN
jgi:kinetochore protein Spc24